MARILREIKGDYKKFPEKFPVYDDRIPRWKQNIPDPEAPNYNVWFTFKGETLSWELTSNQWEEFSNGRDRIAVINGVTKNPEYFVFMYETKFYLSEIELAKEEFMIVLQKEVLSKKDKLRDALDKIKAEAEAEGYTREPIAENVQVFVWNRDEGKCVKCGSNENLEYDHIIPVSKGGSNTARNIQLLCQSCNRSKSNKIGG